MSDLLTHLTLSLDEGGHGHEPDGYPVCWFDHEELHEDDHRPDAWWADAIKHEHDATTGGDSGGNERSC